MTRAGILTKYNPGICATREGKSLGRVGKILQKVREAQEMVRVRSAYVGVGGKRIEGPREKEIRALGSLDHNKKYKEGRGTSLSSLSLTSATCAYDL